LAQRRNVEGNKGMESHVVLPESLNCDRAALGPPPAELYEAYRSQLATPISFDGSEKRSEPRYSTALRAVVVPLNAQGEACGRPFVCLTNNISASGLSLLHTSAISERLLEVELDDPSGDRLRGTLEVLRCRPLGGCFEIAGRFAQRSY
jgi:hypothetical protein